MKDFYPEDEARWADNGGVLPQHDPHRFPVDDDLNDHLDLPPDVANGIPHNPPPPTPTTVAGKVLAAHLDRAMAELGSAMMRLRAARELLGE